MTARTLVAVLLLAACGRSESASPPSGADPVEVDGASVSYEGLAIDDQPRMEALRRSTPADLGFSPATTPWTSFLETVPGTPDSVARLGPASVLAALVGTMGWSEVLDEAAWEQTTRLETDADRATAVVLQWGFLDDAVAGRDFRVSFARDESGWRVVGVERRFHCRRGVGSQGRCM